MVKLIIVNGAPASGKTSFEGYCTEFFGTHHTYIHSTVDRIKEAAKVLGWDGTKTPENRKFLSDLKDLTTQWNDVPFRTIDEHLEKLKTQQINEDSYDITKDYLLVDSREPEEIKRFKEELGAITVLIKNDKAEQVAVSNHADRDVLNCNYDYTICNNGTLDELREKARVFCQLVR